MRADRSGRWVTTLTATAAIVVVSVVTTAPAATADPTVRIGSKKFTESVILAEIAAMELQSAGAHVEHRAELGGTRILWNALRAGEIDAYPEYTGTITQELLHGDLATAAGASLGELRRRLAADGIRMTEPLGFDDTYALGMKEARAAALRITSISDLRRHPELRLGFTSEFMDRRDGWPGLQHRYRLPQSDVRGLDHDLAYRGLDAGAIDLTDLYSTDAEIEAYGLRVLADDEHYFPSYEAVILYRTEFARRSPAAAAALDALADTIDQRDMIAMNAAVKIGGRREREVAADFARSHLHIDADVAAASVTAAIFNRTVEHVWLVGLSLAAAILVALPLGIVAAKHDRLGQAVLAVVGITQTIPSLALLVFMIPLLGIGAPPALAALFLYSLLPIVRNTHAGLRDIPASILESADAMGLEPNARLRLVELPLATRSILAGIKTSAVINVGTATLGALIGAGGYGQPILTGIRLDDTGLILQGAVPAALLALAVQGIFDLAERRLVPAGIRPNRSDSRRGTMAAAGPTS
jgi:osmoprotectant transport system permease protein